MTDNLLSVPQVAAILGLTDEQLAARNLHDVPVVSIAAMRRRWEC